MIASGPGYVLLKGDARRLPLPDGSVDAVICDPPYGTGAWKRGNNGNGRDCTAQHKCEPWDYWSLDWLKEAERVCRGPIGFFFPIRELESVQQCIHGKQARFILWIKTDPRPRFSGQLAWGFEPFVAIGTLQPCDGTDWIAASAPRQHRDADGTGHPHQKPAKVVKRLVQLLCPVGGCILDPFIGSGTSIVAALALGRSAVGLDLSPAYLRLARRRIERPHAQIPRPDDGRALPLFEGLE